MVAQKYRWDFIGLSTDTKPTAETSEKVVNGSTYYCSDTSKLYVYCDGTWYERQPLGGGGGGGSYTAGTGIDITDDTISLDSASQASLAKADTAIQNTDYASSSVAGVLKVSNGVVVGNTGYVSCSPRTYAEYSGLSNNYFISKGTLENVLAEQGGGDTVYSTKTTSNSATGGSVYIGNLDTDQTEVADPTSTDNHYKYFWSLPANNTNLPKNNTINILGEIKGTATQNYSNTIIGAGSIAESGDNKSTYNIILSCGSFDNRSKVGTTGRATNSVMVGASSTIPQGGGSVVVGNYSTVNCSSLEYGNVGVGTHISIGSSIQSSIALGAYSKATRSGELSIGLATGNNVGYNNTLYRVIGGVHDGQELHDAATVAQGNTLATTAPTTSTVGVLGQLYTDTTNMHTYQCTAISGDTYTWTQRW